MIWKTQDGKKYLLRDMSIYHIKNCIRCLAKGTILAYRVDKYCAYEICLDMIEDLNRELEQRGEPRIQVNPQDIKELYSKLGEM